MSIDAKFERLAASMPSQRDEWRALKADKQELGSYALAQAIAGLALDEIAGGGEFATRVSGALEREYVSASPEEEEVIRIGIFEEMCVLLRATWKDRALYEEKRTLVLCCLGPHAKRYFEAWERA